MVGVGQKVKHRPVVPHAVVAHGLPGEQIGDDPLDSISTRAETASCRVKPDRRHIEHGEVYIVSIEQAVDQRRGSTADINHAEVTREVRTVKHAK